MLRRISCFILFWLATSGLVWASDLAIRLQFKGAKYKLEDTMRFQIIYENVSGRTIRVLPEAQHYSANVVKLQELGTGRSGAVIPIGELSMDFEELSKSVVRIEPKQHYTRQFAVKVSSSLPSSYNDKRRGVFLWFSGSAIQLPNFGRYSVIAHYHCGPDHPVRRYLAGGPALWSGEVESKPVIIEFK